MPENQHFVIDFDSTFIKTEGLEELARIALKDHPDQEKIIQQIEELTHQGIEGKIAFEDGLQQRIELVQANRRHLDQLVERLHKQISTSIERNRAFFRDRAEQIYIISAGFKDFIVPIVSEFDIPEDRVLANTFAYDAEGKIIGFDRENPLSRSNGKLEALESLDLDGEILVIGDGYSDYQMKKASGNVQFFAYTENIQRDSAMEMADHVAPSFDEILFEKNLPGAISYPKNRIKVLLLENIHPKAEQILSEEGFDVERLTHGLSEEELCEKIKDVSVLGIRSKTQVTEKVLENAKKLVSVSAFCIGTNQIDLEACLKRGIAVFNAPYSNTRSVVELVIGEIILLMRRIPDMNRLMHEGHWKKSAVGSFEIRGKTLGIVGYGNIGAQLSVLGEALGLNVIFYDKADKLALGNATRMRSLHEMLAKSDIVSLHVDGDPLNQNFFGPEEFAAMKKGSYFLNLARGFVVDIPSLVANLKSGHLAGASIDVFPEEPASKDAPFVTELQKLPNVILTPHIGGSTQEAQYDIAHFVPDKIMKYINTGSTFGSVNFPNLQLPEQRESHRLIHIHRNVPGVMSKINKLFAKYEINIEGQYLKTNETVGYVITDINKEYSKKLIKELRKIDGTLKVRVLY